MLSKFKMSVIATYNVVRFVADDWWQLAGAWGAVGTLITSGMVLPIWTKQPANLAEVAAAMGGLTTMMGIHAWRAVQLGTPNA